MPPAVKIYFQIRPRRKKSGHPCSRVPVLKDPLVKNTFQEVILNLLIDLFVNLELFYQTRTTATFLMLSFNHSQNSFTNSCSIYHNDKSQLIDLPISMKYCNSACQKWARRLNWYCEKWCKAMFGISSLRTNKDQFLHRIQSVWTIH